MCVIPVVRVTVGDLKLLIQIGGSDAVGNPYGRGYHS